MAVTDTNTTEPEATPEATGDQLADPEQVLSLSDRLAAEFERRTLDGSVEGDPAAEVADDTTVTEPQIEGDEGEGGGDDVEVTADVITPPSTEPEGIPSSLPGSSYGTPDQFSMDAYAQQLYGRPLTQYETEQLFAWQQQFSQLSPEQIAQVEAAIAGQPPITTTPTTTLVEDDDNVDPYIQQHITSALAPVQEQLAQVNQFVQTQAQQQAQAERDRVASQIEQGTTAFKEKYGLDDNQIRDLETRVVQNQIFPGLYNAMQGNADQAMQAGLEQVLWADENYRSQVIQQQVEAARNETQSDAVRKRKSTALSGGGGSVSRETPPPATQQGRQAAMATELAEVMKGSGS